LENDAALGVAADRWGQRQWTASGLTDFRTGGNIRIFR
jgi:hypothetical protein